MTTLSEIYLRYSTAVYHFALGLCSDPIWADDLTAETFVRAMVSPNPIRADTVKAYLFTITRNLYLQARRKERRLTELEEGMLDSAPGLENVVEHRHELHIVLAALQKLPEVDRTALLMHAQDGMPYEVIATALGISVAAAKVKVHRARLKLIRLAQERQQ